MAYRDIMVILDNHDADQACLSAAILVAKASKASLVGAFLSQAFVYPYIGADFGAYVPSDVIQKLADDHGAKQMIASQQAKLQFDAAVLADLNCCMQGRGYAIWSCFQRPECRTLA
jgi:hypothetical protein